MEVEELFKNERIAKKYYWDSKTFFLVTSENKIPICNFLVILEAKSIDDNNKVLVSLKVILEDAKSIQVSNVSIDNIEKMKFSSEVDMKCIVENVSPKYKKSIIQFIQLQYTVLIIPEIKLLTKIGWNQIQDNKYVYLAGNLILGNDLSGVEIHEKLEKTFRFDFDNEISEVKIASLFVKLINKSYFTCGILFANSIVGMLFQLFKDAGVPPKYILYILGPTSSYKTTLATYFASLYYRETSSNFAAIDLTSSQAAIEQKVQGFHDCSFVVDDLAPSEIKNETNCRKARVEDIIRTTANVTSRAIVKGNEICEKEPSANLIITAEYLLKTQSVINRSVVIDFGKYPICKDILDILSSNKLGISTLANYFLRWVSTNYMKLVNKIRKNFVFYRGLCEENNGEIMRLNDSGFFLCEAMDIFGMYLSKISKEDIKSNLDELLIKFSEAVNQVLLEEIIILENLKKITTKNYATDLLLMIENQTIRIAESKYDFNDKYCDGFYHKKKNILCLYPRNIFKKFREFYGDDRISINQISRYFKDNGLVIMDESNEVTKKVGKDRFYHINISYLNDYYSKIE